jgi:preprotein translocase subunit YajC
MFVQPGWLFQADEKNTNEKQEPPARPKQGERQYEQWSHYLPIVLMIGLAILVFWLPYRRQQRERDGMMNTLKKGDEVLTHGGILGHVHSVSEKEDEVTVEVASGVRLRLVKAGIIRNYTNEKAAQQAAAKPAENKKN